MRVVVVDYLQLVRPENPKDPRHLQVGLVSQRLKELARSADVAVIACAQLNRDLEARGGNGRPKLSDLRDSGLIDKFTDVVMMMRRLDDDEAAAVHHTDLIFTNNRNGPTGTVPLDYQRPYTRFAVRPPTL